MAARPGARDKRSDNMLKQAVGPGDQLAAQFKVERFAWEHRGRAAFVDDAANFQFLTYEVISRHPFQILC